MDKSKRVQAVALRYTPENNNAPRVAATGQGVVAEQILKIAERHKVPIKKDPLLVEALGQLQLGEEIPPELYSVVAEILVFIMNVDKEGAV